MAAYVDMATAQFENTNALRMYPFADGSSLKDRLGRDVPKDLVVDVHMVVPSDMPDPAGSYDIPASELPVVRLTSVHMSQAMISICMRSEFMGTVNALSVTVSSREFKPYFPYRMEKLIGQSDIGGIITFGDVEFPGSPETYFLDGAVIHPCCVAVAKPPMLRSIVDPRSGVSVSGDVDISFSGHVISRKDGDSFFLSLDEDSDLELASECAMISRSEACGATPIESINGVYPDEYGNIVLWFH